MVHSEKRERVGEQGGREGREREGKEQGKKKRGRGRKREKEAERERDLLSLFSTAFQFLICKI